MYGVMSDSSSGSSIPEEQQPLNQYRELSRSFFSGWPALPLLAYVRGIVLLWSTLGLVTLPFVAASVSFTQSPVRFLTLIAVSTNGLLILIFLKLYTGWAYVRHRLASREIVYEDSGWYDVATCSKSPEEITQHSLIVKYQVMPILRRLHWTFAGLGSLSAVALCFWWF